MRLQETGICGRCTGSIPVKSTMGKRTKREQLQLDAIGRDEEQRYLEEVERDLEENVRRLWKATRWYLGHEEWTFYRGFDDEAWCGCDCNRWNRFELLRAIDRLRSFRKGIYQAY